MRDLDRRGGGVGERRVRCLGSFDSASDEDDKVLSDVEESESESESDESEDEDGSASSMARRCSMISFGAF